MKQHEGGGKAAKYEFGKVIFNDQLSFQNNSSRIGGCRAKQTQKILTQKVQGEKENQEETCTEKLVLAEEKSLHNLRETWHRLLHPFSLLSKELCQKPGTANTIPQGCSPCSSYFGTSFCCPAQPVKPVVCQAQQQLFKDNIPSPDIHGSSTF